MSRIDENGFDKCAECHMLVTPSEYHPYAACVLYKQLGQADKVKSCLDSVIEYATRSELKDGGAEACPHCGYDPSKWVTIGTIKSDIETETETFTRATAPTETSARCGEQQSLLSSEVAWKIALHIKGHNSNYYSSREGLAELESIISNHFAVRALSSEQRHTNIDKLARIIVTELGGSKLFNEEDAIRLTKDFIIANLQYVFPASTEVAGEQCDLGACPRPADCRYYCMERHARVCVRPRNRNDQQQADKCEHGILWSMECLSCGPSDFVAAPATPVAQPEVDRAYADGYNNGFKHGMQSRQPGTTTPSTAAVAAESVYEALAANDDVNAWHRERIVPMIAEILSRYLPAQQPERDYKDVVAANRWALGEIERLKGEVERLSGLAATPRLSHQEDTSMVKNYDGFRAGMLRAAEMARNEFKRAPEAAKGEDCVWMGGYESACDHLSVVIAQAAVIDSVRIAGAQPDWQYHIALLLPDEGVEDQALLKIYQVVEHELRKARADAIAEAIEAAKAVSGESIMKKSILAALEQLKDSNAKKEERNSPATCDQIDQ